MTRLVWDQAIGTNRYEAGVDRGVFYLTSGPGVVWNGLTSVQESPSEADAVVRYIDGVKTTTRRRSGHFEGQIEAFTYPTVFYDHVLSGRRPRKFNFSYRTKTEYSYKIHLVYNVLLSATSHLYEQSDIVPFSWDFTTIPVALPGGRPTAHIVVDVTYANPDAIAALEAVIYGSDVYDARLPEPAELIDLFEPFATLRIIDNGDGTWTAIGPDEAISMLDSETFEITWPSAVYISTDAYQIHSY